MKTLFFALAITLLNINLAQALNLQEAKSQGMVGERTDGYIGYVIANPSDDIKALVKKINNKRRAKFQQTAKNNGISADKVGILFYQRAIKLTKKNNYYQREGGQWTQK